MYEEGYYIITQEDADEINKIAENMTSEMIDISKYLNLEIMTTKLFIVMHSPNRPKGVKTHAEASFTEKGLILAKNIIKLVCEPNIL